MDIVILLTIAIGIIVILVALTIFKRKSKDDTSAVQQERAVHDEPGARRRALAANRNARARQRFQIDQDDEDEANDGEGQVPDIELPEGKVGAKKLAKLQAKAEKKAQREVEEKNRQEKKKAQEIADEERRKEEELEKEEEKKKEEQARKEKEEKERKEHEEYLKLKEAFSVQEEGYDEPEVEGENLLLEFVNYIKKNKVVVIEDVAALFKLKTQSAIDRIHQLQKDRILTGVIDDRGKFIYLSPKELQAVAKFINQRGRVSILELVDSGNSLIDLNAQATASA